MSFIMDMFGLTPPKAPKMPDQAPVADTATPAVQAAADAERKRIRSARGRASTMLTGSGGDAVSSANIGTSKLLGG